MLTIILVHCHSESQKPCRRVGIADRKVFVCPESFCVSGKFLRVFTKFTTKWSLNINIRNNKFKDVHIWLSGKCPESLESFWTVLRVSSSVKSFRTVGKISRQSGKFPNILEKGWLAIAKLKPLSLFISLLSMPQKAFDNVKIEKWKVKVVSALQ